MLNDKFNFNFWPSFTDLMLSLVLVVLLLLSVIYTVAGAGQAGQDNLDKAREGQAQITSQISRQLEGRYSIDVISDKDPEGATAKALASNADIVIVDKLDRQTITFSDKILFDVNKAQLKDAGRDALNAIGPIIKNNLDNISEIQIQGHADITGREGENLALAATRAISVYEFMRNPNNSIQIDPSVHLMSITSFGFYKPIGREAGQTFSRTMLNEANKGEAAKARNRRIEIVLFYKN